MWVWITAKYFHTSFCYLFTRDTVESWCWQLLPGFLIHWMTIRYCLVVSNWDGLVKSPIILLDGVSHQHQLHTLTQLWVSWDLSSRKDGHGIPEWWHRESLIQTLRTQRRLRFEGFLASEKVVGQVSCRLNKPPNNSVEIEVLEKVPHQVPVHPTQSTWESTKANGFGESYCQKAILDHFSSSLIPGSLLRYVETSWDKCTNQIADTPEPSIVLLRCIMKKHLANRSKQKICQ